MSRHNRQRRQRQPGYLAQVTRRAAEAQASGALLPGQVYEVVILHDATCPMPTGRGPCDCTPDVGAPQPFPMQG